MGAAKILIALFEESVWKMVGRGRLDTFHSFDYSTQERKSVNRLIGTRSSTYRHGFQD